MARLPRLYAPAIVQHVVQRPAEGRKLFVDGDDYAFFIRLIDEAVKEHTVALHAFVLLPSQIRLLATPAEPESIAHLMQTIGRRYVPHLNRKTARGGSLWDRRYRSTLIDADAFLLASMRHIERLPVAEGLVASPGEWQWSSLPHHVGSEQQRFIHDHARYWALSDTPFERQATYRALVDGDGDDFLVDRIEMTVARGWVLGDAAFVQTLEGAANRRVVPLSRGRKAMQRK